MKEPLTRIHCELCHREVSMVKQSYADRIGGMEGRPPGRRAYECRVCEAMIFEDELEEGKRFRPRQPRRFWT